MLLSIPVVPGPAEASPFMHTLITCGDCGQQMRLPHAHVGKKVQCPHCGARFVARPDEELVEVELERGAPEAVPAGETSTDFAAQPLAPPRQAGEDALWVEPAEEVGERQAGPLRLRKPAPISVTRKPGR